MASSQNSSSDDHSFSAYEEVNTKELKAQFSKDEEALIVRMYKLVGERWSIIAGRIPGRSAEEIKKYWISKHSGTNDLLK